MCKEISPAGRQAGQSDIDENELVYVCSISEYNLPEYESCLKRRPKYLVLVVSNYQRFQEAAERFCQVIADRLPATRIVRPDDIRSFDGSDLKDFQRWLQEVLHPVLDELDQPDKKHVRVCNLTGGTKVMALALMSVPWRWHWLEYKADRSEQLQMISYAKSSLQALETCGLPQASPIDVARLYSEQVKKTRANRVFSCRGSSQQAQQLWDGLSKNEPSLMQLFGGKNSGLEKVWVYGLKDNVFNHKSLTLSSQEFVGQPGFSPAQLRWLESWAQLAPAGLVVQADKIQLAGNKNRREDLRRWLSGDWLEQLAYEWLQQEIHEDRISTSVRVRPQNADNSSAGERESDILIHYKGRTSIVEVKADLPPTQKIADAIRQLASLADRFGRTNKVLLIGPQLKQKHQEKLEELKLRCKAEGVLLAYCRESLLQAVLQGRQFD